MSADAALVARCLRGERAAERELIEHFQHDVLAICRRLLTNVHDAEDTAQEVFLRVFRSLSKWDNTRQLRPWVIGITINRCRTCLMRRSKRVEIADYLHEVPDHRHRDDSTELADGIRAAVDELRDDFREVFTLFHELGRSYEEIAETVERPVGTIKTWLHRARIELLNRLRSRGLIAENDYKLAAQRK